jgi:hypothetical protein
LNHDYSNETLMEMRAFVQKYAPKQGSEKIITQLHEEGFSPEEIKKAFGK